MLEALRRWLFGDRPGSYKGRRRVNRVAPETDLPCEWCKKVVPTTLNEIWCEAYPEGELRRLCDHCLSGCAGG